MFYAFNKGDLNQHEGDWEMVQIVFNNDKPLSVGYSQHHGGQSATWNQVEREGDHIKVYVARGSYANYLRPYSGKLGIASDRVGDNGRVIRIGASDLEELGNQDWLEFDGFWGGRLVVLKILLLDKLALKVRNIEKVVICGKSCYLGRKSITCK